MEQQFRRPDRPLAAKLFSAPLVGALLAIMLLSACTAPTPAQSPEPLTPRASPAQTPVIDLTQDGNARRAVDELTARAGDRPVIRVTVNAFEATLTYLEPKPAPPPAKTASPDAPTDYKAMSLGWVGGTIEELDSDVEYIHQAAFNPADFNLDGVTQMFENAAAVSGSSSQQELQINEYNQGRVLMTVTTNPETSTVFFRHDGSLIARLDFSTEQGLGEGLRDAVDSAAQVISVGLLPDNAGLFADVIAQEGIVERRIRQSTLPMFSSQRKQPTTTLATFDPAVISPAVIAVQVDSLPVRLQADPDAAVLFTIAVEPRLEAPVMTFNVAGATVVTDLDGNDITEQLK